MWIEYGEYGDLSIIYPKPCLLKEGIYPKGPRTPNDVQFGTVDKLKFEV